MEDEHLMARVRAHPRSMVLNRLPSLRYFGLPLTQPLRLLPAHHSGHFCCSSSLRSRLSSFSSIRPLAFHSPLPPFWAPLLLGAIAHLQRSLRSAWRVFRNLGPRRA